MTPAVSSILKFGRQLLITVLMSCSSREGIEKTLWSHAYMSNFFEKNNFLRITYQIWKIDFFKNSIYNINKIYMKT